MVENLKTEQLEQIARFLLHRMGPETRREMMAQLPIAYATLYPKTVNAVVAAVADRCIDLVKEN